MLRGTDDTPFPFMAFTASDTTVSSGNDKYLFQSNFLFVDLKKWNTFDFLIYEIDVINNICLVWNGWAHMMD